MQISNGYFPTVRLLVNLLSQEDKQTRKRAVTAAQSASLLFDSSCKRLGATALTAFVPEW